MNEPLTLLTWLWIGVMAITNITMLAGALGGAQWYVDLDEIMLAVPILNMGYLFVEVALLVPLVIAVRAMEKRDKHIDRDKAKRSHGKAWPA